MWGYHKIGIAKFVDSIMSGFSNLGIPYNRDCKIRGLRKKVDCIFGDSIMSGFSDLGIL